MKCSEIRIKSIWNSEKKIYENKILNFELINDIAFSNIEANHIIHLARERTF